MTSREIQEALARPFDPAEVKFKPQAVKNDRALAIAYVDARVVMDRLDEVLGVDGWQDEYVILRGEKSDEVMCRLSIRLDKLHPVGAGDPLWVTKSDVGGESEQSDDGDKRKAAFSDALKRTAVKFGIARYLYRLPQVWADFDPVKKAFKNVDSLRNGLARPSSRVDTPQGQAREGTKPAGGGTGGKTANALLPKDGPELWSRLHAADVANTKGGTPAGELTEYVLNVLAKAGHSRDYDQWGEPAIKLAAQAATEYLREKGKK